MPNRPLRAYKKTYRGKYRFRERLWTTAEKRSPDRKRSLRNRQPDT